MNKIAQILAHAAPTEESASVTQLYSWRKSALRARLERRPGELVERAGWPRHAVAEAQRADETRPCLAGMAAIHAAKDPPWLVVISGRVGCGKTVAAAWWAIRQAPIVEFVSATEYLQASRYDGSRARWRLAEALVLDDIGTEYLDERGSALVDLTDLVNEFYSRKRSLVMTTNLEAEAFKARYGDRVADRIREIGGWRSFRNAPSLREAPHGR